MPAHPCRGAGHLRACNELTPRARPGIAPCVLLLPIGWFAQSVCSPVQEEGLTPNSIVDQDTEARAAQLETAELTRAESRLLEYDQQDV